MNDVGALLVADPFLSLYLRRTVFRLSVPERVEEAVRGVPKGIQGPVMIETKVPAGAVALLSKLTSAGFMVVDTNVQLDVPARSLIRETRVQPGWQIRDANTSDRDTVGEIAAANLVTSRFHLDPQIEDAWASDLKRAWAGNFFDGLRGERLFVAESSDDVAGFLLVLERGDQGVIDLIALDPSLRGTGAAAGLVREWAARAPHLANILVGTQLSNLRSLKAYGRMGFRVCGATYVLHYHSEAGAARGDMT